MPTGPEDVDFEVQLQKKELELLKRIAAAARALRGSELLLSDGPDELSNTVHALQHLVETKKVLVEGDVSSPRKMLDSRFFIPVGNFNQAFQK